MNYSDMYRSKLVSAAEAAKIVKSGDWIDYGWTILAPVKIDAELAKRMPDLYDVHIRGGILMREPEIFRIDSPARHFEWNSWHMSGIERKYAAEGLVYYSPIRYSELPRYYKDRNAVNDAAFIQVAPMDENGYFNFGPATSHIYALCKASKVVVVEVNTSIPRCIGGYDEGIHISEVDMIVEGDNPPVDQLTALPISETDEKIAKIIVDKLSDGDCLQLGIGSLPNAIGKLIAGSDLKDLGAHTEMLADSFVDIYDAGKLTGTRKNVDRARHTYSFAMGTKKLYDFLDDNPACLTAPPEYTNDIRLIASIDNFTSINNIIEMDLFSQASAESIGSRNISGAGGQLEFMMGAYQSHGGKSFICCTSTYTTRDGKMMSRIVPTFTPGTVVTDIRAAVNYFVTEYGIVNLKGLSTWQRSEAIISIAHPYFRDELIREAEKLHIWRQSNKR